MHTEHLSYEEVIERAKRYVKNTTEKLEFSLFYDVSFVVNAEKRTVVALLTFADGSMVVHKGIAKAMPEDVFNEHIGKAIALGRVWGGNIPKYFLNAPQPKFDIPNRERIYFASPLFSNSEKMFNSAVVEMIRNIPDVNLEVYLPQENMSINDKSGYADSVMIAEADNKYLEMADVLVAVLDGQTVDVGVAAEVGYFYSMNKPIVGIYTDTRQGTYGNKNKIRALDVVAESQFSYINLYLIGLIKKRGVVVSSVGEAMEEIIKLANKGE